MTEILNKSQIDRILELINQHQAVAFPTDTVFGLGIRYNDRIAFDNMKNAKGRPDNKPFPLMVADVQQLDTVAFTDDRIRKIAALFMPGALTLVLKKKDIPEEFTAGMDTIAVRIPDDEFVRDLLRKAGPMFVTSANLSDHGTCRSWQEVRDQLDGRIAAIVQGEAVSYASSTIIDCTEDELKCLRQGDISLEEIKKKIESAAGTETDRYIKEDKEMLHVIDHPMIKHKLTHMRNINTGTKDFRQNLDEIAALMAYEVTKDFPLKEKPITTPMGDCIGYELATEVVIVPILRAGLGMVNGIQELIPTAKVGHVGLYRDEETLEPHTYYAKFPKTLPDAQILVIDPMLATGGSSSACIDIVKKAGGKNIKLVCLVGVQEGIDRVQKDHPDVDIYLAAKDECLNEIGYIVPGLGDAGDRIFGTK